MKKKIYLVFNNREKEITWRSLYEELLMVFEDSVEVKLCFLDEAKAEDLQDGDLYLVLYKDRVYQMKKYISSLDKVVVLTRTFERKYLDDVYALPEGTDVLIVNDGKDSTLQTTNSLYEIGLNHLNLIPYIDTDDYEKYKNIKVAITPGESEYVPDHIKKIIDVQNRCIDANTFVKIINKLGLNNSQVAKKLLSYIQITTESDTGAGKRYINDYLREGILKQAIQEMDYAIIITDKNLDLVYYNDRADIAFSLNDKNKSNLRNVFSEEIFNKLAKDEDYKNLLVEIKSANYLVTKMAVEIVDQAVGYVFRFNTEKELKEVEQDLSKQLAQKGMIAKYRFEDILYKSSIMEKSITLAKKVAMTDYTVLIHGESGTGKELFAQSIHNFSNRKDKPFVAINCAALPESLLESELFGYEKGAFTGASSSGKKGLFEQANHGTIFLDEIGDMSLQLQARLLRVLQEKEIMRLGSDKIINVDIRIIAATNKDLLEASSKNEFRNDLYYRLSNLPIVLPPLRERREDISYIFRHFIGGKDRECDNEVIEILNAHSWPGNIRELKNVADYYITLGELPRTLYTSSENTISAHNKLKESGIDKKVLDIIRDNTFETIGIGRTSIYMELCNRGIKISDDKLRKILKSLENDGKITIGKGRVGCRSI